MSVPEATAASRLVVLRKLVEVLRATRQMRDDLQHHFTLTNGFPSRLPSVSWVEPIEHVLGRYEEVEGVIDVVGCRAQPVQLSAELGQQLTRSTEIESASHGPFQRRPNGSAMSRTERRSEGGDPERLCREGRRLDRLVGQRLWRHAHSPRRAHALTASAAACWRTSCTRKPENRFLNIIRITNGAPMNTPPIIPAAPDSSDTSSPRPARLRINPTTNPNAAPIRMLISTPRQMRSMPHADSPYT